MVGVRLGAALICGDNVGISRSEVLLWAASHQFRASRVKRLRHYLSRRLPRSRRRLWCHGTTYLDIQAIPEGRARPATIAFAHLDRQIFCLHIDLIDLGFSSKCRWFLRILYIVAGYMEEKLLVPDLRLQEQVKVMSTSTLRFGPSPRARYCAYLETSFGPI